MLGSRYRYKDESIWDLNAVQVAARQQVLRKLSSGQYPLESVSCPICGSTDFEQLAERDRYGLPVNIVICCQCGLVCTNPRMTQEAYTEFYGTEYRKLYGGDKGPSEEFFLDQYEKGRQIAEYLHSKQLFSFQNEPLVLEIGCAAGGILKYFQDHGCVVIGVDLDDEYTAYGREHHGLNLHTGTLAELTLTSTPSLVIFADVLEHLLDPRQHLALLKQFVSKDTLLYVAMPGIKSLYYNYWYKMDFLQLLQNAHVWHFTLCSLQNLMQVNGYRLVAGDETIKSVFRASERSSVSWVSDYDSTLRYLRRLEQVRRFTPVNLAYINRVRRLGVRGVVKKLYQKAGRRATQTSAGK